MGHRRRILGLHRATAIREAIVRRFGRALDREIARRAKECEGRIMALFSARATRRLMAYRTEMQEALAGEAPDLAVPTSIDEAAGTVTFATPIADPRTAAMITALRYARDHRRYSRYAFDYDEWARLVDAAIGPCDPAAKVPDTHDLEAARLAIRP